MYLILGPTSEMHILFLTLFNFDNVISPHPPPKKINQSEWKYSSSETLIQSEKEILRL